MGRDKLVPAFGEPRENDFRRYQRPTLLLTLTIAMSSRAQSRDLSNGERITQVGEARPHRLREALRARSFDFAQDANALARRSREITFPRSRDVRVRFSAP